MYMALFFIAMLASAGLFLITIAKFFVDRPNAKKFFRYFLGAFVAMFLFAYLGGKAEMERYEQEHANKPAQTEDQSQPGSASAEKQPAPVQKKPELTVLSATQLFQIYDDNEVSADGIFKDKIFAVKGRIQEISKTFTGDVVLELQTDNRFLPVRAHMEKSETAAVAKMSKGQQVTIDCTGAGKIIGAPVLNDCTIHQK